MSSKKDRDGSSSPDITKQTASCIGYDTDVWCDKCQTAGHNKDVCPSVSPDRGTRFLSPDLSIYQNDPHDLEPRISWEKKRLLNQKNNFKEFDEEDLEDQDQMVQAYKQRQLEEAKRRESMEDKIEHALGSKIGDPASSAESSRRHEAGESSRSGRHHDRKEPTQESKSDKEGDESRKVRFSKKLPKYKGR